MGEPNSSEWAGWIARLAHERAKFTLVDLHSYATEAHRIHRTIRLYQLQFLRDEAPHPIEGHPLYLVIQRQRLAEQNYLRLGTFWISWARQSRREHRRDNCTAKHGYAHGLSAAMSWPESPKRSFHSVHRPINLTEVCKVFAASNGSCLSSIEFFRCEKSLLSLSFRDCFFSLARRGPTLHAGILLPFLARFQGQPANTA